jgi:uncharacterized protein YutE (UPF0331/DUF86 family)
LVNTTVVLRKISQIRQRLTRLKYKKDVSVARLRSDPDTQDIVLHNLQLAIQGCVDIGSHIIADEGWGIAGSFSEIFYILQEKKVLGPVLTDKMIAMVGFRNLLVHEYETIRFDLVYDILQTHLSDIEEFLLAIIDHFKM